MSTDNVRPIYSVPRSPQASISAIFERLTACRQTLQVATVALRESEDAGGFTEEGVAAAQVIGRCVDELGEIERNLDRFISQS